LKILYGSMMKPSSAITPDEKGVICDTVPYWFYPQFILFIF